jgi:hypothetical protein
MLFLHLSTFHRLFLRALRLEVATACHKVERALKEDSLHSMGKFQGQTERRVSYMSESCVVR